MEMCLLKRQQTPVDQFSYSIILKTNKKERFCRKTSAKVITLTNHNGQKI